MKYIITILFFIPLLASPQGAIVDAGGNIINYQKYTDSIPGVYATGTRLRIKADSVAAALVASLALKSNIASPTFTGTVSGVTATMVGLGNVTNESKATMFTTPAFTGSPTTTSLAATGNITSSAGGIGYVTGNGGTVTQITSKSTTVILNKLAGDITMINSALAAATIVSFTLTNSTIAATDVIHLQHQATGTFGAYTITGRTAAGSAVISIRNNTAGSLGEAIVIRYIVLKSVTN